MLEHLQYFLNILISFVSYFVMIFVFVQLWQYIYTDPSELIAGYSMEQMIWYVMITEIIWFGSRSMTLTRQVANDIKGGGIAYSINKPYFYPFYILSKYSAETTVKLPIYLVLGVLAGVLMVGQPGHFEPIYIPAMALCMILGIIINASIKICISLVSFWVEDSVPFQWIYDKLLLVVGTIFPIEVFPLWLQPFIRYSPVYAVVYGPAKLIIDFSMEKLIEILTTQIIYLATAFLLMLLCYTRGVKKINVNGG